MTYKVLRFINNNLINIFILFFLIALGLWQNKNDLEYTLIYDIPANSNYQAPGFVSIYNGQDLTDWDGDPRFWRVEDGVILGETSNDNLTEANTFLIWEGGEPADFELTFYYRLIVVSESGYGNSGIQVRSERVQVEDTPDLQHRVRGYQPDINTNGWTGTLYEEMGRGALARRGQNVVIDETGEHHEQQFAGFNELSNYFAFTGEWNNYHVYANGDTIRTWINGKLMHQVVDKSPEASSEGIIAFQLHRGDPMRIELRNIQLRTLN